MIAASVLSFTREIWAGSSILNNLCRISCLCYILRPMQGGRGPRFKLARLAVALCGKHLQRHSGYTIIEVMIFLAVTGGLLAASFSIFSGRQARTEFSASAREMESQLQDVINDVSTGYYASGGNFQCQSNPIGGGQEVPSISGTPSPQGTNEECIFVGRIAHFDITGSTNTAYNLYTAAGARQVLVGTSMREVQSLDQANPRAVTNPPFTVDITDNRQIPAGLVFDRMYYNDSTGNHPIAAVGFFSNFGSYGAAGINSGSVGVDLVPMITADHTKDGIVTAVTALGNPAAPLINPTGGVFVCYNGDGTNLNALFSIGGPNKQLATDLQIRNNKCADYP